MRMPSLDGELVHHVRDALGSILVIDYRKHRILSFNSVFEQSKIERSRPYLPVHEYNRAMLLPMAFRRPGHATILGLGGGVLAGGLNRLLPDCEIHAVELRQAVVDVARQYFGLPATRRLRITVGDARQALMAMPDASTDLILADLYSADRMSPTQAQRRFVEHCDRVLSTDGWLAINYHRPPTRDGALFRQLRAHFPTLLSFKSKTNNTVLYASKGPVADLYEQDSRFGALEARLPIDWRRLMSRVNRLG